VAGFLSLDTIALPHKKAGSNVPCSRIENCISKE
jgi:hypothetical protein